MRLKIIPAIDIMDGQLVRLSKGDPSTKQQYWTHSPLEAAKKWAELGAEMIHIIDLDAALGKKPNTELILEIAEAVESPLQVGGGIRSIETAQRLLDGGVERIILGSMPIKAPLEAQKLLKAYGSERVIVALDHRKGSLMVGGWQESTDLRLRKALDGFTSQGYQWFLVTNIDQDGTLEGPDTATYAEIATGGNIIASGGVASINDIQRLKETGVEAVVIGKALYLDRFTLAEAMEAA